jgi:ankyrin repeat protein
MSEDICMYKTKLRIAFSILSSIILILDNGNIECIRSLLDSGSHINCQDVSGATPLHYAINAGSEDDDSSDTGPKLLQYLLEHGADTTFADTYGRLALHWAANAGIASISKPEW